jgi:3'(2'), 5'-bisphosphate nucleotidase
MNVEALIDPVIALAKEAGQHILRIYRSDSFDVQLKTDHSPLTAADLKSHQVLIDGLRQISDLPVLSEEGAAISWTERQAWSQYWLLDPLDGTKEFLKKNGEFTVNVALIDKGNPILGVVYAPDLELLYYGAVGLGAFKVSKGQGVPLAIQVAEAPLDKSNWRLAGSRSHDSDEFHRFISQFRQPDIVILGSSLKMCLVAEGKADVYPRLGPTCEWDTGAAHAIVRAAGGRIVNYETKEELGYNLKESLLNPSFVACASLSPIWR